MEEGEYERVFGEGVEGVAMRRRFLRIGQVAAQ